MSLFSHIRHLLIDLGGVLYEIDFPKTLTAFRRLQPAGVEPMTLGKEIQYDWFADLDQGKIEFPAFAQGLIDTFQLQAQEEQIRTIWLDLLVRLYPGRTQMVQELSQHFDLALLSNTSRVHFDHYSPECAEMFAAMDHLFVSFEMGVKKPDPRMFFMALEQMGWKAEETLFLDDSRTNIRAAEALGIQTVWIERPEIFEEVVKKLKENTNNSSLVNGQ
ncbi:MAG: HAD family phosphatase [Bacteroidota bacterium]